MYRLIIKPTIDTISAILLLILISPIIMIVSLLIFIKMGRPIFFTQKRPGQNGKLFNIYKFRTMNNNKDKDGNLLNDKERLQGFGKKIRELSLDELPQLFNIVKRDMSFIGPRPLLCEYLPLYNDEQKKRHLVKPGMTGLAQVNGRNDIAWDDRFKFDVQYANNISLMMDIKIAIKTIKKVYKKDGVHSSSGHTIETWKGNL